MFPVNSIEAVANRLLTSDSSDIKNRLVRRSSCNSGINEFVLVKMTPEQ